MELLQYVLQLFRDRQTQMRSVLDQAHALVGEIEKDHCRAQYAAGADHMGIKDVADIIKRILI